MQSDMYQGRIGLRVKWVNALRRFAFKQALDAGSKATALSRLKGYAVRDAHVNGAQLGAKKIGALTAVPARSANRGPPFWRSTVLRQKALGDAA